MGQVRKRIVVYNAVHPGNELPGIRKKDTMIKSFGCAMIIMGGN